MMNLLLPTGSMIILILTPGASCILRGTSILLGWCTAILNLETSSWTAVVRRPQRCGKFSWLKDRPKAYKSNFNLWKRGIDDIFMVLVLRSTRNIYNLLRFLCLRQVLVGDFGLARSSPVWRVWMDVPLRGRTLKFSACFQGDLEVWMVKYERISKHLGGHTLWMLTLCWWPQALLHKQQMGEIHSPQWNPESFMDEINLDEAFLEHRRISENPGNKITM